MIQALQRIDQFTRVRRSWFGEGGQPVSAELAQARANVCLTCPKNEKGAWIWNAAARWAIAAQSKLRNIMNLRVQGEEKLGTCEVCGCPLKLRIHVPFKHVYRHTTPEQLSRYPDHCWLRKEQP